MTWLPELMQAVSDLESPRSYFYWSALTTVSAVVGKRIFLNRGEAYVLYPNIYTFIISKKSGLRKGIPIRLAKKLTIDTGTVRVIDGQNSIQGVIKNLSHQHTTKANHVINKAEGFLITGEFASFLIGDNTGFSLTTLTDLYDTQYHEEGFKKRLAGQDEIELNGLCLTALFASNETHFFDSIPRNAITGGFLARTFCIYESKKNTINPLMEVQKQTIDYKGIVQHLKKLSKLKGEMTIERKAKTLFASWYMDFSNKDSNDDTGTDDRLGDNLLKLAMLLSLAESTDLIISHAHMEEAISKTMECFSSLRHLLFGSGDTKSVKRITAKVLLTLLIDAPDHTVKRRDVLVKGIGLFGTYDLDEAVEHFLQARYIIIKKERSEQIYKLNDWVIKTI